MSVKDSFFYINIRDYLALGTDDEAGEPELIRTISEFSCPQNPDVANFLKKNAVEFTKKSQLVTYLVFSVESKELLGYFTLALKPLSVRGETVSNTTKRKLLRISELDESSDTYTMSAYLIAQLGKNYTNGVNNKITGNELVELAWTVIEDAQYMLGGIVTFLEAENAEKLLSFYRNNRFSQFDTRQIASDAEKSHELVQLLRLL